MGFVHFFSLALLEEGIRSSCTLPSIWLFNSTSDINSKRSCSNNNKNQDIATISAIFIQHLTSFHDSRNRTFTLTVRTYETDDHSGRVEHVAPRHPHCGPRAPRAPHRFAGATLLSRLLNLSRVEHFSPRHPRITLRSLRLQKLRRAERVAPRHPASLCGRYAYESNESPVRRARRSAALCALRLRNPTTPIASLRDSPASLCGRYAYKTSPRRARSSRSAEPRITFRRLCL